MAKRKKVGNTDGAEHEPNSSRHNETMNEYFLPRMRHTS